MTDLIYDYITMGVDMMISAAILSAVVLLLRSTTILSSYSATQQATSDRINYYREYSMYDCTTNLYSTDVLSAMVYYRYDLDVVIQINTTIYFNDKSTGKFYVTDSSGTRQVTYSYLSGVLGSTKKFRANLVEDLNNTVSADGYAGGIITGIKFNYM